MAYLAGTTAVSPHIDNFMSTLSTFLQANGWTLADDISASNKVFKSTGFGKEAFWVRFFKTGNQLDVLLYQYWDVVGHVGYNQGGVNGDTGIQGNDISAFNFWIWTDGRGIVIVFKDGANYYGSYSGGIDRVHESNIGILQSGVSAGAGVVCAVDESFPQSWLPGKKVMVLDQSAVTIGAGEVGNEHATVVSAAVGTITLNLAQNHQAGALIGFDPQPAFVNEGIVSMGDDAQWWSTNNIALWNTHGIAGPSFGPYHPMDTIVGNANPDDRTARFLNQPMYLFKSAVGEQEIRGKLAGVFSAPLTGVSSEDTTKLADGTYIAFPIGASSRMVWVPTF